MAENKFYVGRDGLTGGISAYLDAIPVGSLVDGDRALVLVSSKAYWYEFDSSSSTAESSPDVINPDGNAGNGRWLLFKIDLAAVVTGTLPVANGGSGAATLTDHGILLGSGTNAITPLAAATDGQIPIGSTGADPVLATISAGEAIDVTNAAGSITIDCESATDTNKGVSELATNAEASTGTDTERTVVPAALKYALQNMTVTMASKTLTSPVFNTGVSGTAVDTDGTFAANSDTLLASQKAVKTGVDAVKNLTLLAAGRVLIFGEASAPTGWTKKTDWQDQAAILINSDADGTALASGGNSVMTSIDPGDTGAVTLTAAQSGLVGHSHTVTDATSGTGSGSARMVISSEADSGDFTITAVASAPASESHLHTIAAVTPYYQEVIFATKS